MKSKYLFLILPILLSLSYSSNKNGIGFEFHTWPSAVISEGWEAPLEVYFPLKSDSFTIEPSISLKISETEYDYSISDFGYWGSLPSDYKSTQTSLTISIGFLKTLSMGNMESYAGVRIGRISTISEVDYDDSSLDDTDEETESFLFAPVFGTEYFFNKNISLGFEAIYYRLTEEDQYTDSNWGYEVKTESTESTLIPKLIMRFYY